MSLIRFFTNSDGLNVAEILFPGLIAMLASRKIYIKYQRSPHVKPIVRLECFPSTRIASERSFTLQMSRRQYSPFLYSRMEKTLREALNARWAYVGVDQEIEVAIDGVDRITFVSEFGSGSDAGTPYTDIQIVKA